MKVSDTFGVFLFICWFGIGSLNVALAGLELTDSCLTLPCECWYHTCVPAHWAQEVMFSLELKQYFEHFVTIGLFSSQLVPLMLRFLKAGFLWHRWAQCPLKEFFRALSFKRVLILLPTPADPISQFFLNEAINILLSCPTLTTLLLHRHHSWTHTWFGSIQTGIFLRPHLSICLQPESLEVTIREKKWPHPLRIHQGRCCFNKLLAQFLPPQARRFLLWPCFCEVSPGLLQSHREKEPLILVCAMHQGVIKSWWLYLHFSRFLLPF